MTTTVSACKGFNCPEDCPCHCHKEKWNENVETCSGCNIQWKKIGHSCPVCFSPAEKHPTPTNPPTETVSDCYRVSERPYTDKLNAQGVRIRTYNYPGGREALIQRAVNWRGFTREEAEKQYPEEIL